MKNWLQDVIQESNTNEEIFYTVTDHSMDNETSLGYDDLNDIEQKSFLIGKFLLEVNNGGFDQYFLNTKGIYASLTLDFLDMIEEENFSKLLNSAISIFKAVISDDRKAEEFDRIDNQLYNFSGEYDMLYDKYVNYIKTI
jgi:hypothetical protein